jgi:hypothetical protein
VRAELRQRLGHVLRLARGRLERAADLLSPATSRSILTSGIRSRRCGGSPMSTLAQVSQARGSLDGVERGAGDDAAERDAHRVAELPARERDGHDRLEVAAELPRERALVGVDEEHDDAEAVRPVTLKPMSSWNVPGGRRSRSSGSR